MSDIRRSAMLFFTVASALLLPISEACAPYFRGADWLAKQRDFSTPLATARCRDQFRSFGQSYKHHAANTSSSASVRASAAGPGARLCTDQRLFVGRWFCAKECSLRCGRRTGAGAIRELNCGRLRLRNGGRRPEDLFLMCRCEYTSGLTCTTREYSWEEVEVSYILAGCQSRLLSPNDIDNSLDLNELVPSDTTNTGPSNTQTSNANSDGGSNSINDLLQQLADLDPDLLQQIGQALLNDGNRV